MPFAKRQYSLNGINQEDSFGFKRIRDSWCIGAALTLQKLIDFYFLIDRYQFTKMQ